MIYDTALRQFKFGPASAMAMILFAITSVLAVIQFKWKAKKWSTKEVERACRWKKTVRALPSVCSPHAGGDSCSAPLYWMIVTAIQEPTLTVTFPPEWFPANPTLLISKDFSEAPYFSMDPK